MTTYTADQDPADFTVDQVTAFLATASAEDTVTVKAAEGAEGAKGRKGILDYQAPVGDGKPDADGYTRVLVEDAYQPGEPIESDEDTDDTQE